ncbi:MULTISPECIES: hypothetical protein [unclassified Kribbella]
MSRYATKYPAGWFWQLVTASRSRETEAPNAGAVLVRPTGLIALPALKR